MQILDNHYKETLSSKKIKNTKQQIQQTNRPIRKIPQLWTSNPASKELNSLREHVAAKIIAYITRSAICVHLSYRFQNDFERSYSGTVVGKK